MASQDIHNCEYWLADFLLLYEIDKYCILLYNI